ncbi:MAG TPA: hypothetical protein PKA55_12295 [Rhodoblastus sp.]|nr:hypothetical protein [Rhodoblastus sp.]
MRIAGGLLSAAALALFFGAPATAEARHRGWSRACACPQGAQVRHVGRFRARRLTSYRPVLAVDSIPVIVHSTYGDVVVGQRRSVGVFFPHPRWGYDFPWDGYGGPYYGYPPRDGYGRTEY